MKNLILSILIFMTGCSSSGLNYYLPHNTSRVYTGLERFIKYYAEDYRGKKALVITNHSGVNFKLAQNISLFQQKHIDIIAVLAPEHGLYGHQNYYSKKTYSIDWNFCNIIYNLHKISKKTRASLIRKADIVIFDIQDMGMRCYTYISNLKHIMDALRATGKELIVLDRPNPIGFLGISGAYLNKKFYAKYISAFPAPFIYSMTIGESALYYKGEFAKDVRLRVIEMSNYDRDMLYHDTGLPWVPPSPNLPTYNSAIVYTAMVLMEGINLSLGRGTTKPFEYIGAPWLDPVKVAKDLTKLKLGPFSFRPTYFEPTFSKYRGKNCGGVQVFYLGGAFDPTEVSYKLIRYFATYKQFRWDKYKTIDFLAGTDLLRKSVSKNLPFAAFKKLITQKLAEYSIKREKYLLY